MKLSSDTLLVYSTNSWIAYEISREFYRDEHYVWCAPGWDEETLSRKGHGNPGSATPFDIYYQFLGDIQRRERHGQIIRNNRIGIRSGARAKLRAGIIGREKYEEILYRVNHAESLDFRPLLYLIPYTEEIDGRLIVVQSRDRAGFSSAEYKIASLPGKCFDVMRPVRLTL